MKARPWLTWIGLFLLVDVAVAYVANSPIAGNLAVRSQWKVVPSFFPH